MYIKFKKYHRHVITNQPGLNAEKKLLLMAMHSLDKPYELGCHATNGYLAFQLGTSEGAVRNMMAELKADGFVVITGAKGTNGVVYRRVVCPYSVIDPKDWATQVFETTPTGRRPRTDDEVQTLLKSNAEKAAAGDPVVAGPEQAACSNTEQRVCSTTEQQTVERQRIDREKSDLDPLLPGGADGVLLFSQTPEDKEATAHPGTEVPPEVMERVMQSIATFTPFNQATLPVMIPTTSAAPSDDSPAGTPAAIVPGPSAAF